MQGREVADPSVFQALAGHATQFALRHIQPTPMLGSVYEVDPPHVVAGFVRRERFVERSLGVRVQIVAHQRVVCAGTWSQFRGRMGARARAVESALVPVL